MMCLADYLKDSGKTQNRFAEEVGVRAATVSGWIKGTIPRPPQMQAIANVTGGKVPVTVWFKTGSAA